MRGDSGVAGEGRVVGIPKFHSWGKCIMPQISTQIGCPTLPLACVLLILQDRKIIENEKRCWNGVPKSTQTRKDIKVKVNIQSLIHSYIFTQ